MTRRKYVEVVESLELQILSGALRPGDRIPTERRLMEQFEAGRSSVREALFVLQRQGLITSKSGTVPRVSRPTADKLSNEMSGAVRHFLAQPEGLRQMQDARRVFEIGLAWNAARIATDGDIARLSAIHARLASTRDLDVFAEIDVAFHLAIAQVAKSPLIESLNTALAIWLKDQRIHTARAGATFDAVNAQHARILDGIAARDPAVAAQAMQAHLESVATLYWQGFIDPGGAGTR